MHDFRNRLEWPSWWCTLRIGKYNPDLIKVFLFGWWLFFVGWLVSLVWLFCFDWGFSPHFFLWSHSVLQRAKHWEAHSESDVHRHASSMSAALHWRSELWYSKFGLLLKQAHKQKCCSLSSGNVQHCAQCLEHFKNPITRQKGERTDQVQLQSRNVFALWKCLEPTFKNNNSGKAVSSLYNCFALTVADGSTKEFLSDAQLPWDEIWNMFSLRCVVCFLLVLLLFFACFFFLFCACAFSGGEAQLSSSSKLFICYQKLKANKMLTTFNQILSTYEISSCLQTLLHKRFTLCVLSKLFQCDPRANNNEKLSSEKMLSLSYLVSQSRNSYTGILAN